MTARVAPGSDAPVQPAGPAVRFSVVVPAFNEEATLGACLQALAAQTYAGGVEVVVVDNASTDATAAVALSHGARVVHEPQPGVCFARQRGLTSARGEIVVTTDADTTVPPGWLQEIDDEFRRRPETVGVAGPCVYVDGPWWSKTWGRLLFGVVGLVAVVTGRVLYVTATNLAFRRTAFGGYDTRLTQGGDELDVLRRLRRVGPVVFLGANRASTSSRRLTRGLLYTLFVSLCFQYLLGYVLNRVAKRPVVGFAPPYRTSATETPTAAPPATETSATATPPIGTPVVATTVIEAGATGRDRIRDAVGAVPAPPLET